MTQKLKKKSGPGQRPAKKYSVFYNGKYLFDVKAADKKAAINRAAMRKEPGQVDSLFTTTLNPSDASRTGRKPGAPKKNVTFYIETELLENKPDSRLINELLRDHYERQK